HAARRARSAPRRRAPPEGRRPNAVQRRFDAPGALRAALKGRGLELVESAGGTASLRKVPEDTLWLQAMTASGAEAD
ncbi:STN domain-containing protein, partial [Pseudomonas aeruginosa]|uniref:STN domain-containing protein n=1 Tax=Pseudomonas aeruginosa TaxID=287 RepID=UPI0024AF8230